MSDKIRIHFEKNGEQFEGEIDEDVYYSQLFSIFRDHLKPIEQKKFYTLDEAKKKVEMSTPVKSKRFWER